MSGPSAWTTGWQSPQNTQHLVDDAVMALEPVRQALLGSGQRAYTSPAPRGVLMVSVQSSANSSASSSHDELEAVASLRSLRRQASPQHVTLAADNITLLQLERRGVLRLWDANIMLHTKEAESVLLSNPRWREHAQQLHLYYAWKLIAQAASPYEETVFIDNDILVLSRTLVSDLLDHTLHVSDLALVQDPARPPSETLRTRTNLASARARGHIVTAPSMYAHGVPPLCTCVMAYRRTPSVRQLLHRATARLFLHLNTLDVSTPSQRTVIRQSDQEMIWFQLVTGTPDALLRLLVLPEEYYCPAWYPAKGRTAASPYHYLVKSIAAGEAPVWTTRWGNYDCHAVHLHHSHQHLGNARPRIKDGTIEKFEAAIGRMNSAADQM